MKINARRTKELKDAYFIETGVNSEYKTYDFDTEDCTPEQRALLVEWESEYRATPYLEREDEDVFSVIKREITSSRLEKAKKEGIAAAREELQPVIDGLRAEIKSLKAEIKSLQEEEEKEEKELSKEEKFLLNEGFEAVKYDFERYIVADDFDIFNLPFNNQLNLSAELWIDVDESNAEVYVLEYGDQYWTK